MAKKFHMGNLMEDSVDDSSIFIYALNAIEKRVLETALENIYRDYLWHDWLVAQDLIERVNMADITPYLADIIEAIKGMGGGNTTINCCLGPDGSGTTPLPEETTEGDYEGTGAIPDYSEEDNLLGAAVDDNCRRGHYAAEWLAMLARTLQMPADSSDVVTVTALANRQIAQNSINTAVKLLPASDAAVVIDGATGQIVRGGTAIGKVPQGGTLTTILYWILWEFTGAQVRSELAKWQDVDTVGNIIGSSPSLAVLFQRLNDAGIAPLFGVRSFLRSLSLPTALADTVGKSMALVAGLWWVAINRGWDWFPTAPTLAEMFPSVSCTYSPTSIVVRRFLNSVAPVDYTANSSGGNTGFDILQIGSGHSQSRVWVSQKRLEWFFNDTDWETGTPSLWRVRLYEYLPPIDMDSTTLIAWLESNIATYPPSYEFMLSDYVAEGAVPSFALRGHILQVSSSGNGGTWGFTVSEA